MIDHQKQTAILLKLIADSRVKTFQLTLLGDSMLPLLTPGTQAQFQKISPAKLPKIGDIAAIKFQNRLLVHRIIRRRFRNNSREYFTQGDRLATGDGWITKDKIAGIMVQPAAFQSAVYYPQILKIKQAFEAEKIDFVFLKGLPLYLYFGKSYPQRVLADCDVLIDKKDKSTVEKIFNRLGYQLAESAYSKFHRRLKDKLTEVTYFKVINNCLVAFDVHLEVVFLMNQLGRLDALYPQKLVDEMTQRFLKEKQQVKIRGQKFPILAPADLIVYLGLHFFHHNFTGRHRLEFWHKIIKFYQKKLTAKLNNETVERVWSFRAKSRNLAPTVAGRFKRSSWISRQARDDDKKTLFNNLNNEVAAKIKRYHLQNFVYPGFALVNRYFGNPLPRKFMKRIAPDAGVIKYAAEIVKAANAANMDKTEGHLTAGINRFKNIFYLSPSPWYRKILVFFNPAVIYSFFWSIIKKLGFI